MYKQLNNDNLTLRTVKILANLTLKAKMAVAEKAFKSSCTER